MFQTEFIHAIQSISFEWLTKFIILLDSTGTHKFISAILIIIIFGINFRKGIFIAQTVIWTHLFTYLLKGYFALPRPYSVDSNIKLLDSGIANTSPFNNMGAQNFFGKLPDEVVNYYRNVEHYPYGLPSGHSSGAMALWGSVSIVFKTKWVQTIGIALIVLVAFARLYLGKHFFVDVLGGLILGILVIIINKYLICNERFSGFDLKKKHYPINLFNINCLIILPILILFLTKSNYAAQILGINIGFLLIARKQIPTDSGSILMRVIRIAVAFIIFIVLDVLFLYIYEISFENKIRILRLLRYTIIYFCTIWVSTKFLYLIRLYKNIPAK